MTAWLEKHPQSFEGLRRLGARLVVEEKWQKAKEVLERVKALYPEYVGPDNPYLLLAIVFRRLSDPAAEHKVLEELAMRDGDAITAYLRLMELDQAAGDWGGVAKNGRRFLAVNPLGADPAPPARACRRASRRAGRRTDGLPRGRAARRHRPGRSALPAWPSCCARRASRRRPAARSSGHWRKRLASARPISSCSSWSNTTLHRDVSPRRFPPRGSEHHDTPTPDPAWPLLACWPLPPVCRLASGFSNIASSRAVELQE